MTHALTHFVDQYGLLAVLVLMAAESCGVPFPSEVVMPVAGALAALGHLNLAAAIVMGGVGNLVGSLVAYGLAAWLGTPLLLGPGRRLGIRPAHLELADRWFRRHGLASVLVARVLPVVRTYISFPAGLARVPLVPFALCTLAGSLAWSAALGAGGYAVGASYTRFAGPIGTAAVVLAVAVVVALAAWFWRGRRQAGEATAAGG
ncbi:MAG TPA: DedA family protein [Candidatus Micrarchaeia archaeon]|nr:DedA family protein [Candidatus Micrarchaeia archaeon]